MTYRIAVVGPYRYFTFLAQVLGVKIITATTFEVGYSKYYHIEPTRYGAEALCGLEFQDSIISKDCEPLPEHLWEVLLQRLERGRIGLIIR